MVRVVTCLILLSATVLCINSLKSTAPSDIIQVVLASMNNSVDPCNDFYAYSCGGWLASHTLPASEDAYFKSISGIEDNNKMILQNLLTNQYNASVQIDPRLPTLYESCLNLSAIEAYGLTGPKELIDGIEAEVQDLNSFMYVSGFLLRFGLSSLFGVGPALDSKNPNMTIAQVSQGGVALPDPTLYTNANLTRQYLQHITNMFALFGDTQANAAAHAKDVLAFETAIAAGTTTQDKLQNPFVTYNKLDLTGFQALAPKLPFSQYFAGLTDHLGLTIDQINVDVPSFYQNLQIAVLAQPVRAYRSYLKWVVMHSYASFLTKAVVNEDFSFFGKVLQGLKSQPSRNETCADLVDANMGYLLGKYFVQVAFPGASKTKAVQMIELIEGEMRKNLQNVSWMDPTTRANAIIKLSQVSNDVGYPAQFFTYDGLRITPNLFFENLINAFEWNFQFSITQIQKPTNKALWEMTPATVNAYYDPTKNGMVFPSGILQNPFFDLTFAEPIYFGGSGVVMGHELTHGFDDSGRDYDGYGVLRNWWLPATAAKFDELVGCVIEQFSTFEVLPGVYVNGNLTQGENIADMGGTKLAYLALQTSIGEAAMTQPSVVPGLTNEQLFFVAYAQGWCALQTPESLKIQVATNPHSPAKFRAIGPLINHPYFADVYNCPVGSTMNPRKKCAIW